MQHHPRHSPSAQSLAGYSLIEIMVTISVITTIVLLTQPSARAFYNQQDITTTRQVLLNQLYHARSVARTQHQVVRLCQSSDYETCTNDRNWSGGWIVYADLNNDADRTYDEPLVDGQNALRDTISVKLFAGGRAKSVKIDEWGVIRTSGRFEICSDYMNKSMQTVSFTRSGYLRPGEGGKSCN